MGPRLPRRYVWAGSALLGCVVLGVGAFVAPRVVQARVVDEAARRGLSLGIGRVHLGWFNASFDDTTVEMVGVHGAEARFASVRVDVDARLRPKLVQAEGGRVSVVATDAFREELERWRSARPPSTAGGAASSAVVSAHVDAIAVTLPGDVKVNATGAQVRREAGETSVEVGSVEGASGPLTLRATDVRFGVTGANPFRDARIATAEVVWVDHAISEVPIEQAPVPVLPGPLDAPVSRHGKKSPPPKTEPAAPIPRLLPDLHAARAAVAAAVTSAAGRIPEGAGLHVDSLSVRLQRGTEQLSLASGLFDFERATDRLKLNFSTSPLTKATTPLSVRADVPIGPGDIELSVAGGPVPLGLLGIQDGGPFHLLRVDRTSVAGKGRIVLESQGQSLTFDVEGSVHGLSLHEPRLAHDPIYGLDLGFSTRGLIDDKGELRLDDAEGTIGAAHASLHGGMEQTADHVAAAFDFDFPTSSCQALLTSIPSALVPTVSSARMDGTFSLRGRLAGDTRNLDALSFSYDVNDRCRLVDVPPDLDKGRFSRQFTHVVYTKGGERQEETTGPGSPTWSELDEISPYMQVAVLTTEDGAFFHHHGFNHAAIRHAVVANVKAHRFVRGASTITMQLAKNLFLSREKTLARKVEELILADYLEQAFTKDEMMELYLNVIEFGPDLYGVGAAADHYFGRKAAELNLAECMFLSSILPNPVVFGKVYQDGQLGEGWLRTLRARMDVARHNGLISPAELAEGLTEPVEFHKLGAPPPPPRPPVAPHGRPGETTDWEELN